MGSAGAGTTGAADGDSDESLLERFVAGDARAFDRLLERHNRAVFHFALRFLHDTGRAEDVMQDVFMRVIRGAREFRGQSKVRTWLFTIARNLCIDEQRKDYFRRGPSLDAPVTDGDDEAPPLVEAVADGRASTDERAFQAEIKPAILEAIANLCVEQREVFVMREVNGLGFQEIAEVVGVSENTVKSRMRYAIEHLRKALEERGVTHADALSDAP